MKKLFFIPLVALTLLAAPWLATSAQAQPPTQTPQQALNRVLERMRAEKLTPQQLWDEGALDRSLVLRALSDERLLDPQDAESRLWFLEKEARGFLQLLLDHGTENLGQEPNFNWVVQLRLAQYYLGKGDPRGAVLMEYIIEQMPREGTDPRTLLALLTLLDRHYWKTKQFEKALATPYKIKEFTREVRPIAEVFLMADLAAYAAGRDEKDEAARKVYFDGAKQFHDELHTYNDGWASAMARWHAAEPPFIKVPIEEGRALLKTPFNGDGVEEYLTITNSALAQSYFKTQEFDTARRHAEAALRAFEGIAATPREKGVKGWAYGAELTLRRIAEKEQAGSQATPTTK